MGSDINLIRSWLKATPRTEGIVIPGISSAPILPSAAFLERAGEIVRAWDECGAAGKAAREHPQVVATKERSEALRAEWSRLAERVATTPATTLEGLLAKLVLISSGYDEDDIAGTYDGILASAAVDARAIKASREARS